MSSKKVKSQSEATKYRPVPIVKRTSQGLMFKPKNKHARKNFKAYRGQGNP